MSKASARPISVLLRGQRAIAASHPSYREAQITDVEIMDLIFGNNNE
jgi:hypothetical protein